ncbi:hypothetical protein [Kitasatospora sp. NPDC005856]|uniref:hypothetical protein n=1 Tax=Kitasatospora sp. NPDC005856 TaxID=3154566 RepID=UPI00340BC982
MSRGRTVTVIVVAVAGILSTPVFWLMDGPDAGQLVGASVQGASGIAALVWAVLEQRSATAASASGSPSASGAASASGPVDTAVRTGAAEAGDGGVASSGVRRPGGSGGGSSRADRTGNAKATGRGSKAVTGVDHS